MNRSDDNLFRGWKPTPAPPNLQERVMSAVREGVASERRRLTDRLWESRAVRFGWAAAATALVAFNLWFPAARTAVSTGLIAQTSHEVDPVLASLIDKHQLARFTVADRDRLLTEILGERGTESANSMNEGENS